MGGIPTTNNFTVVSLCEKFFLITWKDQQTYGYNEEELHLVASSMELFVERTEYLEFIKTYLKAEAFKDIMRSYICAFEVTFLFVVLWCCRWDPEKIWGFRKFLNTRRRSACKINNIFTQFLKGNAIHCNVCLPFCWSPEHRTWFTVNHILILCKNYFSPPEVV